MAVPQTSDTALHSYGTEDIKRRYKEKIL